MSNSIKGIGLGTVQWGMPYGVSNDSGQVSPKQVSLILKESRKLAICYLDTAAGYGQAEKVLGRENTDDFRLITKTPVFFKNQIDSDDVLKLHQTFDASLRNLCSNSIYGLLVHSPENLLLPGGRALVSAMQDIKDSGRVKKIGVSIYDYSQIDAIFDFFSPDIVQLPFNVLDRRLEYSGHLKKLKEMGVEVHARSVFLQGLLLMPLKKIPPYFSPIYPTLERWHSMVNEQGLTLTGAALSFVKNCKYVDVTLVGVENISQLRECYAEYSASESFDAQDLHCDDTNFINPMFWRIS